MAVLPYCVLKSVKQTGTKLKLNSASCLPFSEMISKSCRVHFLGWWSTVTWRSLASHRSELCSLAAGWTNTSLWFAITNCLSCKVKPTNIALSIQHFLNSSASLLHHLIPSPGLGINIATARNHSVQLVLDVHAFHGDIVWTGLLWFFQWSQCAVSVEIIILKIN